MIGSASSKRPPAGAALGVGDQPRSPRIFIPIEPGVEGVRVARLQQALSGHAMRGLPLGDLQDGGGALANVGAIIVVAQLKEFVALVFGQSQGAAAHRRLSS
jgi:hypothetical protein